MMISLIENEELCIKNEELCIKNDDFCRERSGEVCSYTPDSCTYQTGVYVDIPPEVQVRPIKRRHVLLIC